MFSWKDNVYFYNKNMLTLQNASVKKYDICKNIHNTNYQNAKRSADSNKVMWNDKNKM
jgi:hypothetical protein